MNSVKDNMRPLQQLRTLLFLFPLCLSLWGCASGGETIDQTPTTEPDTEIILTDPEVSLALPPSEFRAAFNAIENQLAQHNWMAASASLDALAPMPMNADDHAYRSYLRARATYLKGDQRTALDLLEAAGTPEIAPGLRYRVNNFHHFVLSLAAANIEAARIAVDMLTWLPAGEASAWRRNAWRDLQRASSADIDAALAVALDPQWMGWLHLAQDSRPDDETLQGQVALWESRNPEHEAASPLPGGLEFSLMAKTGPDRVALLLPLTGRYAPAAQAVQDGFLAAYYKARSYGANTPELILLDANQYASTNEGYEEAVRRGAQLVVGPLSKPGVRELANRLERPVPVLALNRIDDVMPAMGGALIQLSLSAEDEAVALAEAAFGMEHRTAVIIAPSGSWGAQVVGALEQRWKKLGGKVVSSAQYADQEGYSESVKSALGLSDSEQRARQVRDMLATNIEFTPRRRQDPDVIFLLSRSAAQARSLKPLFAFHYAASIPVYALSSAYNGLREDRNQDLRGIHLVETPWLLGDMPELRVAIAAGDTGTDSYSRLNALGADAYLLQSQFTRLNAGPDALFRGSTGLLSLNPALQIIRQPELATFDGEELQRD